VKWSKSYVSAGGRLVSTATLNGQSETIEYHHADRLGTRIVTNPQTGGYFEQDTLPFGTALNAESGGATNRRFTSYDRSNMTGLDYAVNRHYDSSQGKFTQVDPIGMAATSLGNPQSLNLYAYVQNQPTNFVDPSGLLIAVYRCEYSHAQVCDENGQNCGPWQRLGEPTNCRWEFINIGGGPTSSGGGVPVVGGGGGISGGNVTPTKCSLSVSELASCIAKCMNDARVDKLAKTVGDSTGIPYAGDFLQGLTWVGTGAAIGNQVLNATSLGRYPRSPAGGAKTKGDPTSWQHRVFGNEGVSGILRRGGFPNAARSVGWAGKTIGRVAAPLSIGLLVFEGAYTTGTFASCSAICSLKRKPCNQ
jgi:RHS repeat-associated protein